ncbi:MAG: PucR family transcriptional regulator [Glaciihabitans sp.]|nr:PucR family transcriptional regulator [Glaciihabitans sp.]
MSAAEYTRFGSIAGEATAIEAAAESAAQELRRSEQPVFIGPTRERTMGHLLDDDVLGRRSAFVEAVSRRWLDRGGRTVLRAVLLEDSVPRSTRVSFGRHLAAASPAHTTFIREQDGVLFLVTRDPLHNIPLDDWIRDEASRFGVAVAAIGSARHDTASSDLSDAAEQARVAAELSAALPELQPGRSSAELGGWVLLQSVSAGSRRLGDISPAAELLCRSGDAIQRETIEVYLDAGGQARAACELLHIHRTTLYYRLENMPAIVREALDDGMKRSTLHLTLKLVRLWEATGAM